MDLSVNDAYTLVFENVNVLNNTAGMPHVWVRLCQVGPLKLQGGPKRSVFTTPAGALFLFAGSAGGIFISGTILGGEPAGAAAAINITDSVIAFNVATRT